MDIPQGNRTSEVGNHHLESLKFYFRSKWILLLFWLERAKERRNLAMMDEHQLKDLGVSRFDAVKETEKWFWQN
ncbi:MAG: DUF1127 domain-containing protein [SAR324 cluster bacterium]|nr:DUF1127 domain-containing protein [SAR324 cluster bacterium]